MVMTNLVEEGQKVALLAAVPARVAVAVQAKAARVAVAVATPAEKVGPHRGARVVPRVAARAPWQARAAARWLIPTHRWRLGA